MINDCGFETSWIILRFNEVRQQLKQIDLFLILFIKNLENLIQTLFYFCQQIQKYQSLNGHVILYVLNLIGNLWEEENKTMCAMTSWGQNKS